MSIKKKTLFIESLLLSLIFVFTITLPLFAKELQPQNPQNNVPVDREVKVSQPINSNTLQNLSFITQRAPIVTATSIALNKNTTTINVGTSDTLIATIAPTNAANKIVTWKSSDAAVTTVDSNGMVVGIKAGIATITVTTANGAKTADCTVIVILAPDTSSNATTTNSSLHYAGTFDKEVQWVWIRISGNQTSTDTFVKPTNCIVDRTLYLSAGPGLYTISIYTTDNPKGPYGYDILYNKKSHFENIQNLDQRDMSFLLPTGYVESDSPEIINLATDITKGLQTDMDKTKAIHDWVAKNIEYDVDAYFNSNPITLGALENLHNRKAVCQGYAELNAALHRAVGIRAKVVHGVALGYDMSKNWNNVDKTKSNHAWNEIFIDNTWIIEDTTWDAGYLDSSGEFQFRYQKKYFNPSPETFSIDHFKIGTSNE